MRRNCFLFFIFIFGESFLFSSESELTQKFEQAETPKAKSIPASTFFSARQDVGPGIGYKVGYTTIEELLVLQFTPNAFPFFDLKAHRFLDGKYAANAGIGTRILCDRFCKILGTNLYYDFRNFHHSHFHQIGAGLEFLSNRWNIRMNGYFPIGLRKKLICSNFQTSNGFFLLRKNYALALMGGNLEGNVRLKNSPTLCLDLLGGPYYFSNNKCKKVAGGRIGISAKYKNIFLLKITATFDTVFKKRMQGVFGVRFPFGGIPEIKQRMSSCFSSEDLILDIIQRNEIIALDKRCEWEWNY